MTDNSSIFKNLSIEDRVKYALNLFHRQMIHYVLWFTEIRHQMGLDKALEMLTTASEKSLNLQLNRLSKTLGFEMKDGLPEPLMNLPDKSLNDLVESLSVNWLGNDGVWFQAVEFAHGMNEAKRCNDSVWAQFSPVEAWSIKNFLGMPRHPGLDGLKKALAYRLYANINQQSIEYESPDSFVFKMNDCRVQSARKRKGMADYPCKSAGLVEYAYFARAIDDRIQTECIGCPPDVHPEDWFCAWRFFINP
ncbi:MAG: DUF6125 family protein [Desulfobacterales bacterium]|jgi:hypothetical protein|nr:DUF6125 family protein [Desulfobacterales bacterium]